MIVVDSQSIANTNTNNQHPDLIDSTLVVLVSSSYNDIVFRRFPVEASAHLRPRHTAILLVRCT